MRKALKLVDPFGNKVEQQRFGTIFESALVCPCIGSKITDIYGDIWKVNDLSIYEVHIQGMRNNVYILHEYILERIGEDLYKEL